MSPAEQPVVGYHITVTALHHDQNGALQDGRVVLSAVSDQPVLAKAVADVLDLTCPADTGRQWSVRHPDGWTPDGGFTEAGARQRASELGGEAVYRVVGPWRTADPEPTN
ncbi:hypothetical protein [Melissospora conviva]|uniref:hypothetical protein n=1 Tax=Melissospora conviva TaxID=3388432 RepID=UPI003C1CB2CB